MIRDFIKECMLFQTKDKLNIATGVLNWILLVVLFFCLKILLNL